MSGYHFTAKIATAEAGKLAQFCELLANLQEQTDSSLKKTTLKKLHESFNDSHFIELQSIAQFSISNTDGVVSIYADSASVNFDFYSDLMDLVENLGATDFHARLFDSSSGGSHFWGVGDEEIDFDGKSVCVLGIDEEEGIHDALEEAGSTVSNELNTDTEIIVYAEGTDFSNIEKKQLISLRLIEEEYIWNYLELDCQ